MRDLDLMRDPTALPSRKLSCVLAARFGVAEVIEGAWPEAPSAGNAASSMFGQRRSHRRCETAR
jgi:hypothetical protein